MKNLFLFLGLFCGSLFFGQQKWEVEVNGIRREALVYAPSKKEASVPVVFVFHGHGGNAVIASKKMNFQDYYPEALVVFMQGIPGTRGVKSDPEGKLNGWQIFPEDQQGRDILFFDKMLEKLRASFPLDMHRIFIAGHSNGARFANVLWATRGKELRGIVSVSAQGGRMIKNAPPVSVWMCMGKNDPVVPFRNQKMSVPVVKENLGVYAENGVQHGDRTYFKGKEGTELVVQIRNGGHEFPSADVREMVNFMRSVGS